MGGGGPRKRGRCAVGPARFDFLLFIGPYTRTGSRGVYSYRFDSRTGAMESIGLAAESQDPTWLALHPSRPLLFATNELISYEGQESGSVSAFTIDKATGRLTLINRVSSQGMNPSVLSGRCDRALVDCGQLRRGRRGAGIGRRVRDRRRRKTERSPAFASRAHGKERRSERSAGRPSALAAADAGQQIPAGAGQRRRSRGAVSL